MFSADHAVFLELPHPDKAVPPLLEPTHAADVASGGAVRAHCRPFDHGDEPVLDAPHLDDWS